jgi:hypothetical protein
MGPRQCCPTNHGAVRYGLETPTSTAVYNGQRSVSLLGQTRAVARARVGLDHALNTALERQGDGRCHPCPWRERPGERREPGWAAVFMSCHRR